jgi:hypothetical protein
MKYMDMDKLNRIYVDDAFLIALGGYLQDKDKCVGYANVLTEKKFTIKDSDSTYRVINHWSNLGLFDDDRPVEKKGWRKFSIVDLTWLQILTELRSFGLSLDKIKVGYTKIKETWDILECGISLCFLKKGIAVIVFSDGHIEVVPREAVTKSESIGYLKESSYLVISLNNCLNKLFPSKNFTPTFRTFELSEKEISLLTELRSGGCDEISVRMRDGVIYRIDAKSKDVGEIGKLSDIFNAIKDGDFTVKKQDGKIVYVEKTKKTKV